MGAARNQLLAEVKQLKALTSGKIELKPVEELDQMKADDLLEYAQNVASDIDIRRQILDEGLKGVSKLEENYAESRQQDQKQQQETEEQFEKMAANLEDYQQKMVEAAENAEKAAEIAQETKTAGAVTQDQGEAAEHLKVVATQRDQLQLLSNRVKVLQSSNKELQGSNDKMYMDLDTAVKRLIPLRSQIEELKPYATPSTALSAKTTTTTSPSTIYRKSAKQSPQAICGNRPLHASTSPRKRCPRSATCRFSASNSNINCRAVTPTSFRNSEVSSRKRRPRSANCPPNTSVSSRK